MQDKNNKNIFKKILFPLEFKLSSSTQQANALVTEPRYKLGKCDLTIASTVHLLRNKPVVTFAKCWPPLFSETDRLKISLCCYVTCALYIQRTTHSLQLRTVVQWLRHWLDEPKTLVPISAETRFLLFLSKYIYYMFIPIINYFFLAFFVDR